LRHVENQEKNQCQSWTELDEAMFPCKNKVGLEKGHSKILISIGGNAKLNRRRSYEWKLRELALEMLKTPPQQKFLRKLRSASMSLDS